MILSWLTDNRQNAHANIIDSLIEQLALSSLRIRPMLIRAVNYKISLIEVRMKTFDHPRRRSCHGED
jgi:hypothetical protein